jgi:outer membrane protein assembly factor BamD (BamD/ComL family)
MKRALAFVSLSFLLVASTAKRAHAQDVQAEARAAYEAGAAAYDRKEYASAARHFRAADDFIPNARALKLALASAFQAGDGPFA